MAENGKTWRIEVEIMPKQGVNDPQGEAVLVGLRQIGFDGTRHVRVGRFVRVEIEAEDEEAARLAGQEMCERLLANPVIEEFVLTVHEAGNE